MPLYFAPGLRDNIGKNFVEKLSKVVECDDADRTIDGKSKPVFERGRVAGH
ncbi:hypothetical protein GCM10011571_13030 [Marinithermofilum abyssi]|uniref:Uncharacterized protein n=1 Tax=Marinithermofilum abyssi TaxID=1571185 RepID=A0A8J2YC86_9BACL|nr:hypothetical protein GCM10011571_13030 [Marinithermofilum abyssi]